MLIRQAINDPFAMNPQIRFAVFINAASPLRVFELKDVDVSEREVDAGPLTSQAEKMFLRPSALRYKNGVSEEDRIDHTRLLELLKRLKGKRLVDGTSFLTDGQYGLCRWENTAVQEALIDVPTLHIRSTEEDEQDPHHGLHLLGLCDHSRAKEFHHAYGHDFPRGRSEMKRIAQLIRECAESAHSL